MLRFSGSVLEGMVVLFLTGVKDFSQLKSIENGCGTHPASSSVGMMDFLRRCDGWGY
jgi:hypothetical protein